MNVFRSPSAVFSCRATALALFVVVILGCRGAAQQAGPPTITLATDEASGNAAIDVMGVADADLARLRGGELSREQWAQILRVTVAEEQPPMLGSYAVTDGRIRFTPMFPLDPGRQYHATFNPTAIPGSTRGTQPIVARIGLPASQAQPSTIVSHVYPSADVVPENQLRLYLHFSAPMGRKGGLDFIHLLDEDGKPVEDPFLPLDAEFWNDDRTRYTVFFDPGRQKRGIKPNNEMGRSLVPGRRYTLVVDREWRDGEGLPLKETFRREFRVGPADERPLDPSAWRVTSPPAGTRDPLVVAFPEPLDHGLLRRALGVMAAGEPVRGEIRIEEHETRWTFTPAVAWRSALYQLVALAMLEDLAGNRIGRAFEVDRFDRADDASEPERTIIPFKPRVAR